jgi:hypothetical protein
MNLTPEIIEQYASVARNPVNIPSADIERAVKLAREAVQSFQINPDLEHTIKLLREATQPPQINEDLQRTINMMREILQPPQINSNLEHAIKSLSVNIQHISAIETVIHSSVSEQVNVMLRTFENIPEIMRIVDNFVSFQKNLPSLLGEAYMV